MAPVRTIISCGLDLRLRFCTASELGEIVRVQAIYEPSIPLWSPANPVSEVRVHEWRNGMTQAEKTDRMELESRGPYADLG